MEYRMSNLQVLVAAMKQDDLSLADKMNIKCDAIIANQHDNDSVMEKTTQYGRVKMITTPTRGVGLNRNIALMASDADIVLTADEDLIYYDDAFEGVVNAFETLPGADVILFGLDMTKNGEIFEKRRHPVKRLKLRNSMKFGGARIAIRREAVLKHKLNFSQLFGGGCIYSSGEDSLFIRDCFKAGLRVYSHSLVLGKCAKDTSSWFTGFNEKLIYDKGAWIACAFPKAKHFIKWYFVWRFSKKSGFSAAKTAKLINKGIVGFSTLTTYEQAKNSI